MTAAFLSAVLLLSAPLPNEGAAEEKPVPSPAVQSETSPEIHDPPEEPLAVPTPGIRKLDKKTRAKVLSALAGFVILWLAIIAFIWLGARFTRRYMHGAPRLPTSQPRVEEDDWARKKLAAGLDDESYESP